MKVSRRKPPDCSNNTWELDNASGDENQTAQGNQKSLMEALVVEQEQDPRHVSSCVSCAFCLCRGFWSFVSLSFSCCSLLAVLSLSCCCWLLRSCLGLCFDSCLVAFPWVFRIFRFSNFLCQARVARVLSHSSSWTEEFQSNLSGLPSEV